MPPSESPPASHVEPLQPLPGRAPSFVISDPIDAKRCAQAYKVMSKVRKIALKHLLELENDTATNQADEPGSLDICFIG
jgi:hypothetical protein